MKGTSQDWQWRVFGVSAYFALQGISIGAWWLFMLRYPAYRIYFHTSRVSERALFDFAWPDVPLLLIGSLICAALVYRDARAPWTQRIVWLLVGGILYPTLYVFGATLRTGGEGWAATMLMLLSAKGTLLAAWSIRPDGELFRIAPRRPTYMHILRTLVQTAFFWVLALWFTPWLLLQAEASLGIPRFHTPAQSWLPWVFFILPGIANVYMGYTMSRWGEGTPLPLETARRFVIKGGYRWVRNPMAVSGLFLGLMIAWWLGSYAMLATVLTGGCLWHFLVKPIEEKDLRERFGASYDAYCAKVRCWLPCWPPHEAMVLGPLPEIHEHTADNQEQNSCS